MQALGVCNLREHRAFFMRSPVYSENSAQSRKQRTVQIEQDRGNPAAANAKTSRAGGLAIQQLGPDLARMTVSQCQKSDTDPELTCRGEDRPDSG